MKRIILFSFFFYAASCCFANKIDSLKTPEDVLKFIKKTGGGQEHFRTLFTSSKAIHFDYIKLDIDKNGLTDILINGIYLYAILDKGDNHFVRNYIGNRLFSCELLTIDSARSLPLFIIQKENDYDNETGKDIVFNPDTLVNRFGGFLEYNADPKPLELQEIKFMTARCFGTCPVFDLTINKNKEAFFNAKEYNKLTGKYAAVIDDKMLDELTGLLSYISIDSLKNNYTVGWTDLPDIDLELEYNGLVKKIHDYGLNGTFGLKLLYAKLFDLKAQLSWE